MYTYGITTLSITSQMTPAEISNRRLIVQIWNHYQMVKSGITTLAELGYRTIDNQIPAFWLDVFNELHRLAVEAEKNARK